MSDWRYYKNKIEQFKNNNKELIQNTNFFNIKEKTNNTWKDIYDDFIKQTKNYKKIMDNFNEIKSKEADATRVKEIKKELEDHHESIRREEIRQTKRSMKAAPVDDLNEFKNIFYDKTFLEENIKIIQNANIQKDGLEVFFNNHETKFSDIKETLLSKINSTNLDSLYLQVFFKTYDGKIHFQTYSLNNEHGRTIIYNLLNNKKNLDNEYYIDENQNGLIDVSDSNNTEGIQMKITSRMLTGFRIINKANENKKIINKVYCDNGGSFYIYKINEKYLSNKELLTKLERYQIFNNLNNKAFDVNCLVYAMIQTKLFNEDEIESMKTTCYTRYISKKQLEEFGEKYQISFKIVKYEESDRKWKSITRNKIIGCKQSKYTINLALINKHYILNEDVKGINKYYLEHYDEINEECYNKPVEWRMKIYRKDGNNYKIKELQAHMKSYDFVQIMTSDKISWSFDELCHLKNNLYEYVSKDIKNINNYCDKDFQQFEEKEKKKNKNEYSIYFADTETDISGDIHKAFCIVYSQLEEDKFVFKYGLNCLKEFLEDLPNNALVYFHNLAYDIRQFHDFNIIQGIEKGTKIMNATINYKGKIIYFKDSLSIINMKLADFPKAFGLKTGSKEMFPYHYYKLNNLTESGNIKEAGKLEIHWNQQQFEENINTILECKLSETTFDKIKYVKFYCKQDVNILKQGFKKFREMCLEALQIDVNDVLTAPSLANQYFTREIYNKIPNYMKYSGVPRAFIQKAVYGGRCMTKLNKRYKITEELADFDAVSLYPSAMARLYCVMGKPEVLQLEELNTDYLLNHTVSENEQPSISKPISCYVVEIKIKKINKHLNFPCIVYKDIKTNTNRNDDINCVDKISVVDNITLEDWIKFNGLECEIIRGYKWCGQKSFLIREVIQKLHNLRCEYKKTKNPLQLIIKLIMNSAYGKMIQKPITTQKLFKKYQTMKKDKKTNEMVQEYPLNKYLIKNSAKVINYWQINNNLYKIKVGKQIDNFYTNTLLGVQILSMSKRIMNEVMVTAEDLNINIYYQDTDSMHIQRNRLNDLANEFKRRFGRELIGSDLGQFHNDFDEVRDGYAYQSIFNGKKMYIDLLKNDKGEYGIHYRMKGVNLECVKIYANENNISIYDVYNKIFNGESITFDLLKATAGIKLNDNMTTKTIKEFKRTVKATANL